MEVFMGKKLVDYADYQEETLRDFKESRVLLVSQAKQGSPNAMAIGWGQIGIVWRKPVFTVLVRPSRYTYELIEEAGEFTVNIVPPQLKDLVQYCGTVSGRNHEKFQEKGITTIPSSKIKTPIIRECVLHYECKIIYKNDLISSELEASIVPGFYPKGDFHRLYFGEILACQKEG
jgi:flavin reductase (DIM6/NTAB) family NADH-FMN oxidoreductase RutF